MLRTIFAAVPLAVLALAAPAAAEGGRHATTYKAELGPVAEGPVAAATRHEDEGVRGKAKLVDGPRRDKVQLHVRGLTARQSYSWSLREASGDAGACTGEAVDAFAYEPLDARRRGHARERARSRTFTAEEGTSYAVVVTAADGTDVACGEFASKRSKPDRKAGKGKHGKAEGKRHDDQDEYEDEDESEEPGPDDEPDDEPGPDDETDDDAL